MAGLIAGLRIAGLIAGLRIAGLIGGLVGEPAGCCAGDWEVGWLVGELVGGNGATGTLSRGAPWCRWMAAAGADRGTARGVRMDRGAVLGVSDERTRGSLAWSVIVGSGAAFTLSRGAAWVEAVRVESGGC
jgi:hypothetical protein